MDDNAHQLGWVGGTVSLPTEGGGGRAAEPGGPGLGDCADPAGYVSLPDHYRMPAVGQNQPP